MNLFQKEFTGLLQAAFSKPNNAVLSPDFDWDKAVKVASIHNIAAILYYGALNCGIPQNTDHMQKLFDLTCKSIMISEQQQYEINRIVTEFEKENIEYMPLKGMVLRSIYPKPEMRTMGDADILIKLETYNRTSNIMKNLGFEFKNETDHEFIWKNPFLYLELHKSVMTSYNKDFYKYFGTGWKIAQKNGDGVKYEMSPEDFYIYIFVHFTKHYRISGIGIKHLLDLWVISEAYPKLNKEYISNELKKMHLHEFYLNVLDTINVWFSNGEENEKTELITNVIYESGQYGIASHAVVSRAIRDNSGSITNKKIGMISKRIFLSYKEMRKRYKILEKLPFLLPVMWIIRCFDLIFVRKNITKQYFGKMKLITSENVDKQVEALRLVGLNFEEK